MPKKAGIVFVMMGAVLMISALLLFLYNDAEDERAGQESENLLAEVQSVILEREEAATVPPGSGETEPMETVPDATEDPEMSIVEIDGYEYIGFLTIPDLELELPVMSDWDYQRLKLAPCRQFGSTKTDDLVIAAHNYKKHFGQLKTLSGGETVTFTDMNGRVSEYRIVRIEMLDPKEVAAVQDSGHDLVLYTCTYGGSNRVVAFCDRAVADD